jgi:hypothetical protein
MGSSERPDWWQKNAELRDELGLPEYEPSRLLDGTYVHEVLAAVESEYGVTVELVSEEPSHPSTWAFVIDGVECASAIRRRDERGNNVYQITAEELRQQIDSELA